jgi:hypothetical protein
MSEYDTDFLTWTGRQAELLRRRATGGLVNEAEIDWLNIAEEIESVGGNTRRELRNRLARLLQHLLKWHYQPEHRSRNWRSTIRTQRQEIEDSAGGQPFPAGQTAGTVPGRLSTSAHGGTGRNWIARLVAGRTVHDRAGAERSADRSLMWLPHETRPEMARSMNPKAWAPDMLTGWLGAQTLFAVTERRISHHE